MSFIFCHVNRAKSVKYKLYLRQKEQDPYKFPYTDNIGTWSSPGFARQPLSPIRFKHQIHTGFYRINTTALNLLHFTEFGSTTYPCIRTLSRLTNYLHNKVPLRLQKRKRQMLGKGHRNFNHDLQSITILGKNVGTEDLRLSDSPLCSVFLCK